VLAEQLHAVRADIGSLADSPVRSILDLGAGTGTGTFGLLRHFAGAHALAVDSSEEMLERLRRRADDLGLQDRVSTLRADLDDSVPEVAPVDLAWASASLHHLADPDRTLAELVAAIRPGGLLAVVELAGFPRFVPDATPGGAAEARAHALLAADRAMDMPAMGSDWGVRLTAAGLVVERDRPIVVDLAPPSAPLVGDYAAASLMRIHGAVADRLETRDREALDALLDGGTSDVRRRSDLHVTTERRLWIARRPAASTPSRG
jgi:SAM-dependent methyltransferase